MRVLLVNDCAPGLGGSGGVETHIRQLHRTLGAEGIHSAILAHQRRGLSEQQDNDLFLIQNLNAQPVRKRFIQHRRDRQTALEKAKTIIQQFNPDVIHIHNLMNPQTLNMLRECAPVVKSIHDCRPFCAKPYPAVASRLVDDTEEFCDLTMGKACWKRCYACAGRTAMERIEAWTYFKPNLQALEETLQTDQLIVYSKYIQDLALRRFEDKNRIHVLPLFTDAESVSEDHIPKPLHRPVFLFAGRLSPEKGIFHILEALRRIPEIQCKLVFAGDGPAREELARQAETHCPNHEIELTGFLNQEQLYDRYRNSTALLVPSIGSEGCSLTGIEAMFFELPAIGYDCGGIREWLVDELTGIMMERGDIGGIARAMKRLASDPKETARLGLQARIFVQRKFQKNQHIKQLIKIYQTARNQNQSPSHDNR